MLPNKFAKTKNSTPTLSDRRHASMPYFVYILLCQDGTFYTGYTKDVEERAKLHTNGRGAKYTKSHPPKEITYVEEFVSRSEAMKREKAIKKLNHEQKAALARSETKLKSVTNCQKNKNRETSTV
jgi:putative endonuclease